jgi:hypothetical protein
MGEHVPGSMDIRAQEKTFNGFLRMVTWGAVISVLILIVMALADA